MVEMERGKPHERETQILVGEPIRQNKECQRDQENLVDKCLSPACQEQNMAYKILFILKSRGDNMKEIGDSLKEARENIGLSIEEVASDLKLRPSQIENIEAGNIDAFKDVFYLKYFIRDYSKYLGLSYEDMIDEFNEYLFDYTSKISLEDIKKAKKKADRNQAKKEKRIASPYTIEKRRKINSKLIILIILSIMAVFLFGFIVKQVITNNENKQPVDNVIR